MIWGALLGGAVDLAKDFIKGKVEESKIKRDIKLEKLANDASWEKTMAEGTSNSLKDEFFTIILSLPIIAVGWAVFTGNTDIIDRVDQAFVALQSLPEWYQYLLFIAVTASFGIKGAGKVMDLAKKK